MRPPPSRVARIEIVAHDTVASVIAGPRLSKATARTPLCMGLLTNHVWSRALHPACTSELCTCCVTRHTAIAPHPCHAAWSSRYPVMLCGSECRSTRPARSQHRDVTTDTMHNAALKKVVQLSTQLEVSATAPTARSTERTTSRSSRTASASDEHTDTSTNKAAIQAQPCCHHTTAGSK
jgi:hypothetical protein